MGARHGARFRLVAKRFGPELCREKVKHVRESACPEPSILDHGVSCNGEKNVARS